MTPAVPTFTAGLVLGLSLIMALGPQNAHLLRMGLQRQHVGITAVTCMLSDMLLIGIGVLGLAQIDGMSEKSMGALVGTGALFLTVYGWRAFQRFLRPLALAAGAEASHRGATPMSRRQAMLTALAFSWLNPHAWLDTAVLIGSASLAYGAGAKVFGIGAAAGSVVWFTGLGLAAFWLGRRLSSLLVWRALDGLVALMMWGTAGWLLGSLF
jgi:L-lysine exporter family protein LysE/ArgO